MNIHERLFVEIHPFEAGQIPHPHPVTEAKFDPSLIYKVLGMYNASETSECYFVLVNPQRQIWFIPQRHLLAFGLLDSNEFFLTRETADRLKTASTCPGGATVQAFADTQPILPSTDTVDGASHNGVALNGNHVPGRNGFADPQPVLAGDQGRAF